MLNKNILITGANRGIGKATALILAEMQATVVLVCRIAGAGERIRSEIMHATANRNIHYLTADLSRQSDVRALAKQYKDKFASLEVLINNAGVILPKREITADGLEAQFAVNHLAPFILTNLLIGLLKQSAPSRIVNVSSAVHHHASLDFDDLQSERNYRPNVVYANTKLANILFTKELSRRLAGTGVTANSLAPGAVMTKMLDQYMGMENAPGLTPTEGAATSVYLATSPDVDGISREYFEREKICRASPQALSQETGMQLWEASQKLTGLTNTI